MTERAVDNKEEKRGKEEKEKKKGKKKKKERLGRAIHVVGGDLIVRCDRRINIHRVMGATVVAKGKKKVGNVHDIFGPVARPYVHVRLFQPDERRIMKMLGNKLYYLRK